MEDLKFISVGLKKGYENNWGKPVFVWDKSINRWVSINYPFGFRSLRPAKAAAKRLNRLFNLNFKEAPCFIETIKGEAYLPYCHLLRRSSYAISY